MNRFAFLRGKVLVAVLTAVGLLVAGGGFALYWFVIRNPDPKSRPVYSPGDRLSWLDSFGRERTGKTPGAIAALGRLQPRGEVIDIGGLMGDRLGRLDVQEGDPVKKGQVLGTLDSYDERLAEKNAFEAQLTEARARLAAEEQYWQAQKDEADLALRQAEDLDPLDVQAAQVRAAGAKAEYEMAKKRWDSMQNVNLGSFTPQDRDQARQWLNRSESEWRAAEALSRKAEEGQKLAVQRAQVLQRKADAGLAQARATIPIASLERSVQLAKARVKRTEIKAPDNGTILKILARPGEKLDHKPILRMGNTDAMYAVAEVYEDDALLVKPEQRATVRSPAFQGELTGKVERIGRMIFKNDVLHVDPAAAADARVVEVWVKLDDSTIASRLTNLQVDVKIFVGVGSQP